ncbi:3-isopropylmalate dehydratase large subunit [Brevundimonas sp. PAMC22021]|uniref:3-isopropylmalate dehydratase large subunit n=1 Tax=Brevundimonas sp. PAMC22021 TaxID=2861285 RepID=UPI001C62CE52|nr:3-isopropylmalate dehydratase large subunit [Brevundimonas sp. PAMC22021]QYF86009.1 3-isopropylmalate dehydratase large subunit [Brevundimonas sp. PAMC22021]
MHESPRTLFDKVWDAHLVRPETPDTPGVLYVDLHLVHEVTSPQAFAEIESRGLTVRRPDRTFATLDHSTPTLPSDQDGRRPYVTQEAEAQVHALERNCATHGVPLAGWDSEDRGVVHVMGPELGLTQPGMTVVCGDSHTATHGAFGALAFGIGTSEVGHVLATQCLLQRKARTMRVTVNGRLQSGVSGKDLALAVIAAIGFGGGTGHVIEYAGEAVRSLDMEGRMTLCNMSIEAGARAGMIAPDDTTFAWLKGRRHAPQGPAWSKAVARWRTLKSDPGAVFDKEVVLDGAAIRPMATWGTTPDAGAPIGAPVPQPRSDADLKAQGYMGFEAGQPTTSQAVDVVFIGSCTNGRLPDLRAAAEVLRGRKVDPRVRMLVVPGSEAVRRDAEAEGLHQVFLAAGAEWRIPGCSMCIAMNGDFVAPGQLAVSTSNRNFEGRQGKGARTILASPATAAASAVAGVLTDPRAYLEVTEHA